MRHDHDAIPSNDLRPLGDRCLVCSLFEILPAERAVDPESEDEADSLCTVHRARMTEGGCVLCGNRLPWMDLSSESWIGWCRPCFVERLGERTAQAMEESGRRIEPDRGLAA